MLSTQEIQLAQGALFLIDNTPECPQDTKFHTHLDAAIQQHLARHTYTYQARRKPGEQNKTQVTAEKLREYLKVLYESSVTDQFKRGPKETYLAALFRMKSRVITESFKTEHKYNRETFKEGDLPGLANTAPRSLKLSLKRGTEKGSGGEGDSGPETSTTRKSPGPVDHREHHRKTIGSAFATAGGQVEEDSEGALASASLGKRKREADERDTAVGPSDGKKSRMSDEFHPPTHQGLSKTAFSTSAQPVPTPSPLTPKPNLLIRPDAESTPSGAPKVAPHPEHASEVQETITPGPLGNAAKVNLQSQQKTWQLDRPTREALGRQLLILQHGMREGVDEILGCIGDITNTDCALILGNPSDALVALQQRCLGADWRKVYAESLKTKAFRVCVVTMSLISAFLYNNILSQRVSIQQLTQDVTKMLASKGELGEAFLHVLDLPQREPAIYEAAHAAAVQNARNTLAQDDAAVQLQLQKEAEAFTKDLWEILAPFFHKQFEAAQIFGIASSDFSEQRLLETFQATITPLFKVALNHKYLLLATGCEHNYTWPIHREKYDSDLMKILGANEPLPLVVRFTLFPGLDTTWTSEDGTYSSPLHLPAVRVIRV